MVGCGENSKAPLNFLAGGAPSTAIELWLVLYVATAVAPGIDLHAARTTALEGGVQRALLYCTACSRRWTES